jgi:hypothetical protein
MAYIGREPQIGNFQVCDAISVVDAQAAYTMQVATVDVFPESANHMLVSLNGILQAPTTSYTVAGSTITFASALETGDVIDFIQILGNVLDLGVPSDNTVTTAKLSDSSVTTAKLNDASVSLAKLTATGTKDATTFLRGDNTFAEAGGGKVLQVVSTTKTDTFTGASGDTWYTVTGLSASITPSSASNKILISGHVMGSSENISAPRRFYVKIQRDASDIAVGDAAGSRLQVHNSSYSDDGANNATVPINFLDSPSSTSSLSYTIQVRDDTDGVRVNAAPADSNSDTYPRSVSTITLMEIAG